MAASSPRQRLEDRLTQLVTAARSQRIRVVPDSRALELVSTRFAQLPPGVELSPARLTIEFLAPRIFWRSSGPWCLPCRMILRLSAGLLKPKPRN